MGLPACPWGRGACDLVLVLVPLPQLLDLGPTPPCLQRLLVAGVLALLLDDPFDFGPFNLFHYSHSPSSHMAPHGRASPPAADPRTVVSSKGQADCISQGFCTRCHAGENVCHGACPPQAGASCGVWVNNFWDYTQNRTFVHCNEDTMKFVELLTVSLNKV